MSEHPTPDELRDWAQDALPEDRARLVESHIESCAECEAALEEALEASRFANDPFEKRIRALAGKESSGAGTAKTPAQWELEIGEHRNSEIGPYKLLQVLGEGGMGTVWMAQQEHPVRRTVALKIIKAGLDTKEVVARFEAERQALALMSHPNIARVLDAGATQAGRPYFVMEHVKGVSITEYCDDRKLDVPARLELFCTVCEAIQHAHRRGILHRDIKPSNILVSREDGAPLVKVIDFGLAKAVGGKLTEKTLFTSIGQMVGTAQYMSPEQAATSGLDVDTRTDVYSLGVLLYELLTGTTPLDSKKLSKVSNAEKQRIIREVDPQTPSTRISATDDSSSSVAERRASEPQLLKHMLKGDLDVIVMKALAKEPDRRYDTPGALAADVQRHLAHEPVEARPASAGYRLRRFYERNRTAVIASGLIAATLVVGAVSSAILAVRATRAEALANSRLETVQAEQKKTKDALAVAETARAEAEAARDASDAAREEAEAVSELLIGVLQSPDPARDGSEITVAELLDRSVGTIRTALADQPERLVRLEQVVARTYRALGLYEASLPIFRSALERLESMPEADGEAVARAKLDVAEILHRLQRTDGIEIAEEAYEWFVADRGERDRDTIAALIVYANNVAQKDGPRGGALRREALALAREVLGSEDELTIRALVGLAETAHYSNRRDECVELRTEAYELAQVVYGPQHPETLGILLELVKAYKAAQRIEEGVPLAKENLRLSRKVLGPDHRNTFSAMGRLAGFYMVLGRYDDEIPIREQVVAGRRRAFGPHAQPTRFATSFLVARYACTGRDEQACNLAVQYVQDTIEDRGEADDETAQAKNDAAYALARMRAPSSRALELALEWSEDACASPTAQPTYFHTRALVLLRAERMDEALESIDRAFANVEPKNVEDHLVLAMVRAENGDAEGARKALRAGERKLPKDVQPPPRTQLLLEEAREIVGASGE